MSATTRILTTLQAVNDQINLVPYVADNPAFGEVPDTWKFRADGKGFVCRDYAVAKAAALIADGWPRADLSVVLCYTEPLDGFPAGEFHAVLWAEAGGESWVLDNRFDAIYRWDKPPAPYRWALRQVAGTDGFLDISAA
jgi:predicted transglutaminase-like cysteine proteinase